MLRMINRPAAAGHAISSFGEVLRQGGSHCSRSYRADMARTLPEGDPRYATDFLPRMDGAGCPPGGGGASGSWWPWARLCQELRTQELAGVLWPTWRRFEPSSSPSASRPAIYLNLRGFLIGRGFYAQSEAQMFKCACSSRGGPATVRRFIDAERGIGACGGRS